MKSSAATSASWVIDAAGFWFFLRFLVFLQLGRGSKTRIQPGQQNVHVPFFQLGSSWPCDQDGLAMIEKRG